LLRQKSGKFHDGHEKMKRFLLAGALPFTRFVRLWARCAKQRHQEAMIYLAYERELITKAEIDGMLMRVDEFDGSCLPVIAERKKAMAIAARRTERGISTRAILSRLENWVIGGRQGRQWVPDAMSTAAEPTGDRALRLSGKSCPGEPITRDILKHLH
jgi:hypothetical protein